ncbi:MAG: glycosyltransferase family 4 protein [Chloroflexota bacterium]
MTKIRVLHPITRLIIGGAQENTMLTADLMNNGTVGKDPYQVEIVSGPQTGPEGSLIEEVRQRGIPLTILPGMRRELSPLNDLRVIGQLRRLMTAENGRPRYDIVHTHSSKAGVVGRLAAAKAKVPLIIHTVHGWSFHDRMPPGRRGFYVALERIAARYSHKMIVVSPKDIDKGLEQGIGRPDDYVLIRSGIELDRFGHPIVPPAEMRRRLGIPLEAPVIGSVTRLSPQKSPLDLIDAFAHVQQQRPDTWLVVVGDGLLRPQVEQRLEELGIASRVVLTGLRRDIPELMAAFDIFVLSSLWEGLPRVLPQAMASGLPIVCTAADGTAEAVVDGENGFLTPRGQPEALAARVLTLLADEQLRREMGENGRFRAPEFGAVKMVQDIDNLYRLLGGDPHEWGSSHLP